MASQKQKLTGRLIAAGVSATVLLASSPALLATDYYLGSTADRQGGTVVSDIAELNALTLQPGDRVAFQAGETFTGTVEFEPGESGTPANPITVTSYGEGRATIASGIGAGIKIYNAAGIAVSNLDLVGSGAASNQCRGIDAGVYLPDSTKLDYLRFEKMKISGYYTGVEVWAWYSASTVAWPGFRDVALVGLEVYDNCSEGIKTWGSWRANSSAPRFSHADFYLADCVVYGNRGDPAATWHTGSGIILSGVDRGIVEYCVAHDNGGRGPAAGGGPFGIWLWESHGCMLQHNIVYNQKTSSTLDGGAYDLDGGTSDSTVQYNYSYNNDGPAIGIIQFRDASPLVRNVVRYNVSENDARRTGQGVLYVGQYSGTYGINTADVYGNTFYVSTNPLGGQPAAANVADHSLIANIRIRNNLFVATHTGALIGGIKTNPAKALYQGNNYWGGTFDLNTFRSGGQENVAGEPTGSRLDPLLTAAGQGGGVTDPLKLETTSAYQLLASSPIGSAGLDLTKLFSIDVGGKDFYGQLISSTALPVGAATPVTAESIPAPPAQVVDEFTGAGGLSDRAPDTTATAGQRWAMQSGAVSVSGGEAVATNSARAVIDGGASDGVLETTITYGAVDTGIIVRSSDAANYLRAKLTTGSLNLAKISAGAGSTVVAAKFNFVLGQTYSVKAVLAGPVITVLIDDVAVVTTSCSFNETARGFGLFAANTGTRKWARFAFTASALSDPADPVVVPEPEPTPTEPASPSGTVLVSDTFTGTGSLNTRVPDTIAPEGNAWSVLAGSLSVSNGSAAAGNSARAVIDVGASDGVLESTLVFGANDTGLVFRCVDATNYLRIVLTTTGLKIRSYQSGVGNELSSAKFAFILGQTYQVKAVFRGSTIIVSVDDVVLTTVTSSLNQTATRFGLFAANTGTRAWQDFSFSSE